MTLQNLAPVLPGKAHDILMPTSSESAVPGATVRILIIEDDPIEAMRIRQLLARAHRIRAEVESADRLAEGMERLAIGGFDVVLLDLNLPDSRGLDTYTYLSAAAPHMPVIVLSAYAEEVLAMEAITLGAQDYLLKGQLSAENLGRAVRCAVQRNQIVSSLKGMTLTDDLTGLFNRRGFTTLAGGHLKLGQRVGSEFLVLCIDLDGLKSINDTLGHAEGDLAIRETAEVLRETFRQSDVLARFGGDEFAVLALDSSHDGGQTVLARLEATLRRHNQRRNRRYPLAFSIGLVAFAGAAPAELPEILERADRALYDQKRLRHAAAGIAPRSRRLDAEAVAS